MATDSSNPEIRYNSYADFVVQKYGGNGYHDYREDTCIEGRTELHNSSFKAHRRTRVEQAFLDALHSSPSQNRTRLILLRCGQLGNVNELYIDAIGLRYKLDPHFFSAYFGRCLDLAERDSIVRDFQPALPPSQRQFMQVVTDSVSHMAVAWKVTDEECTFIILGFDLATNNYDPTPHQITILRDELMRYEIDVIKELDENPADYLYPYLRQSVQAASTHCSRHAHELDSGWRDNRILSFDWGLNQELRRNLMFSRDNLSRFVGNETLTRGRTPKVQAFLADYEALIQETQVLGLDMQGLLQQQANSAAIEETKRGIAQADAVRRLTIVAFVFIPLNFACSFFGMNIRQLGTGELNIGYFFLLAALAGGLCFVFSTTLGPLEAAWWRARRRYALREYQDDDKDLIASITKSEIFWSFVRRHFPPANAVYKSWRGSKEALAEELEGISGEFIDLEELSFKSISWYICRKTIRNLRQRLRIFKSAATAPDPTD